MIRFEQTGRRPDGEKIYRLVIDDRVIREGMTIDEVIAEIHRDDAASGGGSQRGGSAAVGKREEKRKPEAFTGHRKACQDGHRSDGEDHSVRRDQGIPPYGGDRRPAAERRRMARREPSQARSASHECPRVAMGSADE